MTHELSLEELAEQNIEQIVEAHSDDNKWFTGEEVGHSPTEDELLMHFAEHGGGTHYREEHDC